MPFQKEWFRKWIAIPLFFLLSALAYLPNITHFGYFRDDWYLMYAANAFGGGAFQGIYASDRPMRAYVMSAAFSVFGINPLYYNLAAYLFRVLGALAFLWTLRMLWPRQRSATMIAAILFLLYPGFISTPNAIDYQAQQLGLFLAHLSIAFSVKAVHISRRVPQVLLWLSSVLMTWVYLGCVEYFLGLEVFRMAAIGLLVLREPGLNFWPRLRQFLLRWSPFAIGPLGFAYWRFFLFESERKATDLGAQLARFQESPLTVGVQWLKTLLQDTFEVLALSWGVPLVNVWNTALRLRELMLVGVLVLASIFFVVWMMKLERQEDEGTTDQASWWSEAFWLGLVCVAAGFIPVILSNREANFDRLSRYMLASSSGAVIFVAALIDQFRLRNARIIATCLLVSVSILTHYFNGIGWTHVSDGMRNFWWQVSWRAPQLQAGTTLVANYSTASLEEDYFVWGPANLIYYPESTNSDVLQPALSALVLSPQNIFAIQTEGETGMIDRRSIITFMDYHRVLILTQPTPSSCVQVIDGNHPALSEYEQYDIRSVAASSDMDLILLDQEGKVPPKVVFGSEPERTWCYYYEKASIAYQHGDWQTVLDLGQKAKEQGYSAVDPVEWMPFLQAAAILGDRDTIVELAPLVKKSQTLTVQACNILMALPEVDENTKAFVRARFCD